MHCALLALRHCGHCAAAISHSRRHVDPPRAMHEGTDVLGNSRPGSLLDMHVLHPPPKVMANNHKPSPPVALLKAVANGQSRFRPAGGILQFSTKNNTITARKDRLGVKKFLKNVVGIKGAAEIARVRARKGTESDIARGRLCSFVSIFSRGIQRSVSWFLTCGSPSRWSPNCT
jgi:hypothetical protein